MRPLRTALCAAAILPLLVLAVSAPLNAMRCRFTGEILSTCCCPRPDADQATSIGAGDCCEHERVASARPDSEPPVVPALPSPIAWVRPLAVAPPALAARASDCQQGDAVPRPPLILVKRAFLI